MATVRELYELWAGEFLGKLRPTVYVWERRG
jgi:hypothetical protein